MATQRSTKDFPMPTRFASLDQVYEYLLRLVQALNEWDINYWGGDVNIGSTPPEDNYGKNGDIYIEQV